MFEFKCEQKPIVLLRIAPAKSEPIFFFNETYVRIGSHLTKLKGHTDLMRKIYNSQEDWSAKIINAACLHDLDEQALNVAREKFRERHYGLAVENLSGEKFLDKAKLTINGKITNAALLLLGKPEAAHYLSPAIAEITWKLDTLEEKAYDHFGPPFLLNTEKVKERIRNVKQKFFPTHELLATTVDKYDPKTILEALHNCIAHQDYSLRSRIVLTEQADKLIFDNAGTFFEGTPEEYLLGKRTPSSYRNPFLVGAMVNLGMIDTMGFGINRMCVSQRTRYFPLPEYNILANPQKVILQIYGKEIDPNYSNLLIQRSDLSLEQVLALDRVQRGIPIPDDIAKWLKKEKLIEGRKPNYFVGAKVAQLTNQKAEYTKHKALNNKYYQDLIMIMIEQHGSVNRKDINSLLGDKLSDKLTDKQRYKKIDNLIYKLKAAGRIKNIGSYKYPKWTKNN
ncbi:MAG: transcriptional regulator [Candidatus Margulisbacteria bacterium]|nr:transcriptional regulator [Candidatus Margulisiibacteriota bacterium]